MREAISGNQWQSELRPELSREHLRAMREAISGNQWQSELRPELSREHLRAMREAISGNQRPSSGSGRRDEHLVGRKDEGRPAGGRNELCHRKGLPCARGTFKDETWWSHLHALREAISGNQWQSVALSGNQWQSVDRPWAPRGT